MLTGFTVHSFSNIKAVRNKGKYKGCISLNTVKYSYFVESHGLRGRLQHNFNLYLFNYLFIHFVTFR